MEENSTHIPHLCDGRIEEYCSVLHDSIKQVQAVHVGQVLQVLVRVGLVQLIDQLGEPFIPDGGMGGGGREMGGGGREMGGGGSKGKDGADGKEVKILESTLELGGSSGGSSSHTIN